MKFEELKAKQKEAIMKWKSKTKNVISPDFSASTYNASNNCTNTENYGKKTWKVRSVFNNYMLVITKNNTYRANETKIICIC